MTITNNFTQEKKIVVSKLEKLQQNLKTVQEKHKLDLAYLIQKIDSVSDIIKSGKFTIALFGAFSDGKTSIISALLKKLETDMIIDIEEATNEIQIYKFPDLEDIHIIDTPGLFGTKEKPININGKSINLGKTTIKYISEAQAIIYTVDAVNPLRESHFPILKWLMRDLNKLQSVIFVINKMDTVADLTDSEDFEENALIKRNNVIETLKRAINLKKDEIENLKIVCISADPDARGLEFWLNMNFYEQQSRIVNLRNLVDEFVNKSKEELIINSGISVVKDIVIETIKELDILQKEVTKNLKVTENQLNEINNKISNFERDIIKSHVLILEEVFNLREDIISHLNNANSKQVLSERVLEKIGKEGYVLQSKVNTIIEKHTNELATSQEELLKAIELSVKFHQNLFKSIASKYGNKVVSGFAKVLTNTPIKTLADSIKSLRDFLKVPFKFKPWQAIKFAKALAIVGTVIDALSGIVEIWQEFKFKKEKRKIIDNIDNFFKDFSDEFKTDAYVKYYFPNFNKMKDIFTELEEFNKTLTKQTEDISKISKEMKSMIEEL